MVEACITEFGFTMGDILNNWNLVSLHTLILIRQQRNESEMEDVPAQPGLEGAPGTDSWGPASANNPHLAPDGALTVQEQMNLWGFMNRGMEKH